MDADNEQRAIDAYNRGVVHFQQGEFDKAIAEYTEAIRLDPELALAYNNRGIAHYNIGEHDKAIDDFTEVIRLDSDCDSAFICRGIAYHEKGRYDEAITDFTEAIKLSPKPTEAYWNRGVTYGDKGEYGKAIDDFTEVIRIDPNCAQAIQANNNMACLLAACPEPRFRDGEKAVEYAKTACELTGWRDYRRIDTLAAAYAEAGDFDKAVEWQQKVLEMAPQEMQALLRSHLDLYKAGKPCREEPKN